jgi:hypothetical protein
MKKNNLKYWACAWAMLGLMSCELDNYDYPSATLKGSIIDVETNELLEQDILNGSTVQLSEHGYDPVSIQYLPIRNSGEYQNTMLFPNTYKVEALNGNFVAPAAEDIEIKGVTTHDFKVLPYLRIKNVSIVKEGDKIRATFSVQNNVSQNVTRIGLYSHLESSVGEPLSVKTVTRTLNRRPTESETFSLEIDLPSSANVLVPGKTYYFRVGGLIAVGSAKMNYAKAIAITV